MSIKFTNWILSRMKNRNEKVDGNCSCYDIRLSAGRESSYDCLCVCACRCRNLNLAFIVCYVFVSYTINNNQHPCPCYRVSFFLIFNSISTSKNSFSYCLLLFLFSVTKRLPIIWAAMGTMMPSMFFVKRPKCQQKSKGNTVVCWKRSGRQSYDCKRK